MNIRNLEKFTRDVVEKLGVLGADFCVVGGIAVSFRSVERTTNDVDLAVAVTTDAEAEQIVRSLKDSGYHIALILEHDVSDRLSTVRLTSPGDVKVFVDLLFASSGIEREVVETAREIAIFPNLPVKVATIPSLIALKVLSANMEDRLQDIIDLRNLLRDAGEADIVSAEYLLNLITERGYNRNKDLLNDLEGYLKKS